ncbi:MAG: cation:proton antiporter family protein [Chloroflexota bacterium]
MPDLSAYAFDLELTEQLRFILQLGGTVAAALVSGAILLRLRQPAIVGYLLAGIAIGALSPENAGEENRIAVLADVGVVLLLFALGVEFSIRELREIRHVALPGGVVQIAIVLGVGAIVMVVLGHELREALVIGACLSISSTLVVIKTLLDRGETDSLHGRAAIGWSIVQDIATILFIVALPPLAGADFIGPLVIALVKAAIFLVLAYVLGTRLLPLGFAYVARLGSNELFLLAVVATALLTAFASSALFGLSLALGAFVAGLLVSESDLSYQAAAEVIPFRDLFAVLFFVSVGMLLDPVALLDDLPTIALLVGLAVVGKGAVIALLGWWRRLPVRSALLLGAGMSQVGEFSFILAENGLDLGILSAQAYNLILGTAVVSILVSPLAQGAATHLATRLEARRDHQAQGHDGRYAPDPDTGPQVQPPRPGMAGTSRTEQLLTQEADAHRPAVVVLGGGHVGGVVVKAVRNRGFRVVVVDRDPRRLEELSKTGAATLFGDAANPAILARCGLDHANVLVIAVGDPLSARLATERALRINPRLMIAARARGQHSVVDLRDVGARRIADPDAEAAFELARHALQRMGVSGPELTAIVTGLRRDVYGRDRV